MTIEHAALQLRRVARQVNTDRRSSRPLKVMGILNVTPDSFWRGSRFAASAAAVAAGRDMFAAGAWAVDVGGESTRPGAVSVSPEEEYERIAPVVSALSPVGRVSIDTRHPEVAEAAAGLGASIINDVSGTLHSLASRLGAGYVGMHSRSVPVQVDGFPVYENVYTEVTARLTAIAVAATAAGITELWIDPGIGFGKNTDDNLRLLRRLTDLCSTGIPVLLGASRKSFIGDVTGRAVDERLPGSLALVAPAWTAGVDVIRVHDVAETIDTITMLEKVWGD